MKDPIVEEIREFRLEHTRRFGGNLAAICEDLKSVQKISGHIVVHLTPENQINKSKLTSFH